MPSAWDEREQILRGMTDTQKALMKRREELAARETPNLGQQLTSTGGIATGLLALLAAATGEGEAASSLAIGGLKGAADAVTRQKKEKIEAVDKATDDVFRQINADQARALQMYGMDPETFINSAVDNETATAALGLPPELDLVGAYKQKRAKEERNAKARAAYELQIPMAETPEERYAVTKQYFQTVGVPYSDEQLRELAEDNLTYDMLVQAMEGASDASRNRINDYIAAEGKKGRGINDRDLLNEAYGMIDYIGKPLTGTQQEAVDLARAKELWIKANMLARQMNLPVEEVLDVERGIFGPNGVLAAEAAFLFKTTKFMDEAEFSIHKNVMDHIDGPSGTGASEIIKEARQWAADRNQEIDQMNLAGQFEEPMKNIDEEDYAQSMLASVYNNTYEAIYGSRVDAGQMSFWRMMDALGDQEGVSIGTMMNDPATMEAMGAKAQALLLEYGGQYDQLVNAKVNYDSAVARAQAAQKAFEDDPEDKTAIAEYDQAMQEFEFVSRAQAARRMDRSQWILTQAAVAQQRMVPRVGDDATLGEFGEAINPEALGPGRDELAEAAVPVLPGLEGAVKGGLRAKLETELSKTEKKAKFTAAEELAQKYKETPPVRAEDFEGVAASEIKDFLLDLVVGKIASEGERRAGVSEMKKTAEARYAAAIEAYGRDLSDGTEKAPTNLSDQAMALAKYLGLTVAGRTPKSLRYYR